MSDPLRLRIAIALSDALKEIHPDNGYSFDLRDQGPDQPRVVRGRLHTGNDEPLPMVTIIEPPMAIEPVPTRRQPDNTNRVGEWDLIIQGWTKDDPWNPTDDAYRLVADVNRRIALEKNRGRPGEPNILGFSENEIMNMTIGSPVVRPNEHISEQGVFYFVLTLQIAEDMAV